MASTPPRPERSGLKPERSGQSDRPGHPSGKAALVMVGVVVLIIVLAALSTFA